MKLRIVENHNGLYHIEERCCFFWVAISSTGTWDRVWHYPTAREAERRARYLIERAQQKKKGPNVIKVIEG